MRQTFEHSTNRSQADLLHAWWSKVNRLYIFIHLLDRLHSTAKEKYKQKGTTETQTAGRCRQSGPSQSR